MVLEYRPYLKKYARDLRLWRCLRGKQINGLLFYRQKPIGSYIVDFYCHDCKLIIEVDGGQHMETEAVWADKARDQYLNTLGF